MIYSMNYILNHKSVTLSLYVRTCAFLATQAFSSRFPVRKAETFLLCPYIYPFYKNILFLFILKYFKTLYQGFYDVYREYGNGTVTSNDFTLPQNIELHVYSCFNLVNTNPTKWSNIPKIKYPGTFFLLIDFIF